MKDTKVIWPEAVVALARHPQVVQFDPLMIRIDFRGPVDDITSLVVNSTEVTDYLLASNRLSTTFLSPGGAPVETISVHGRPRNLDGAYARLQLKGPYAVLGAEKLLQQIIRLSMTKRGSILGHEDVHGYPDLKGVSEENVPQVVASSFYRIAQIIMRKQRTRDDLPQSGRLLGIDVLTVFRTATGDVRTRVRINTPAGSVVRQLSWEGVQ